MTKGVINITTVKYYSVALVRMVTLQDFTYRLRS